MFQTTNQQVSKDCVSRPVYDPTSTFCGSTLTQLLDPHHLSCTESFRRLPARDICIVTPIKSHTEPNENAISTRKIMEYVSENRVPKSHG
jgi:hypothetical protein